MVVVRRMLPNTRDIPEIAGNLISAATITELLEDPDDPSYTEEKRDGVKQAIEAERELGDVNIVKSVGSSLVFEAVILLIAISIFCRKDF